MTSQIAFDAYNSRIDDFHRQAAAHRRAAAFGVTRRRTGRLAALIHPRRVTATNRSATTTA